MQTSKKVMNFVASYTAKLVVYVKKKIIKRYMCFLSRTCLRPCHLTIVWSLTHCWVQISSIKKILLFLIWRILQLVNTAANDKWTSSSIAAEEKQFEHML